MKAPEKIYLQVCGDCNDDDCKNCKFEDLEDNATWCMDKIFDKDIEYARTDAFIEKACEWLQGFMECSSLFEYEVPESEKMKVIENFKKAMEE